LETQIADLKLALGSLIQWTAQSAGSPISQDEANRLLKMMEGVSDGR